MKWTLGGTATLQRVKAKDIPIGRFAQNVSTQEKTPVLLRLPDGKVLHFSGVVGSYLSVCDVSSYTGDYEVLPAGTTITIHT